MIEESLSGSLLWCLVKVWAWDQADMNQEALRRVFLNNKKDTGSGERARECDVTVEKPGKHCLAQ